MRFELLVEENRIGHGVQGYEGDCIRKMNISEVFGQMIRVDSRVLRGQEMLRSRKGIQLDASGR